MSGGTPKAIAEQADGRIVLVHQTLITAHVAPTSEALGRFTDVPV
jgi:hypothetical protein